MSVKDESLQSDTAPPLLALLGGPPHRFARFHEDNVGSPRIIADSHMATREMSIEAFCKINTDIPLEQRIAYGEIKTGPLKDLGIVPDSFFNIQQYQYVNARSG